MAEESLERKNFRLITWNIHLAKHYTKLIETVKTDPAFKGVDVLVLQESSETNNRSTSEEIAELLGPQYAFRHEPAQRLRGRVQANAIVWNTKTLKDVEVGLFKLPLVRRWDALRYRKGFKRNERLCLRLDAKYGSTSLRIYAPHFDTAGGLSSKLAQFDVIRRDNEGLPVAEAVFIAGDLNTFSLRKVGGLKPFREAAAKYGFTDISQAITVTWNSRGAYRYLPSIEQKLDWILLKSKMDYTYTTRVLRVPGSDHYPLVTDLRFQKPQETTWEFYWCTELAWKAMLQDCQKAEASIDFESYIFIDDAIGKQFMSVFIQKAQAGVRVRMLIDALGSHLLSWEALETLRKAGVEILEYNPPTSWITRLKMFSLFNRDHRKILVVDNRVAYTGGIGINEIMSGWRDTQVRIQGPVVEAIASAFEHLWYKTLKHEDEQAENLILQTSGPFTFRVNSPYSPIHPIAEAYIEGIHRAKSSFYFITPYFAPPKEFLRAMVRAAKRGVDVRALLPQKSDHPYLNVATGYYFSGLLRAGVKIYLYENSLLHSKTATIDEDWATVGSMNLDTLSFYYLHEANLFSFDPRFNADLQKQFLVDLKNSKEITLADWKRRPMWRKILEVLLRPFHMFF